MADHENKQEIRRVRTMLLKMTEMAQQAELTGSFESGVRNYVKRYNAIVEYLEGEEAIPEDLFPCLNEQTDFGQLGAESALLADYLNDFIEEKPVEKPGTSGKRDKADMGMMVALAPFLGSEALSKLVREHLGGEKAAPEPEETVAAQGPDLKTIVGLAPHLDAATLGEMVRACLARQKVTDPKLFVALAPHMETAEFSRLLREYLPEWFGGQAARPESEAPAGPAEPSELR